MLCSAEKRGDSYCMTRAWSRVRNQGSNIQLELWWVWRKVPIHTFNGYKNKKFGLAQVLKSDVQLGLKWDKFSRKTPCVREDEESHVRLGGLSDHHASLVLSEGEREGRLGRSVLNCRWSKESSANHWMLPNHSCQLEVSPVLLNGPHSIFASRRPQQAVGGACITYTL